MPRSVNAVASRARRNRILKSCYKGCQVANVKFIYRCEERSGKRAATYIWGPQTEEKENTAHCGSPVSTRLFAKKDD